MELFRILIDEGVLRHLKVKAKNARKKQGREQEEEEEEVILA